MRFWRQQKNLLKARSFQFYLCSSVTSVFGSGLAYIVNTWMIISITPTIQATLLGMILFWLPSLLLSPQFGFLVDHYDRRKLIITAKFIRAITFLGFGYIIMYFPNLWCIYILQLCSGVFSALYKPLFPAFVQEIVPSEQLIYANTYINMVNEMGNIISRGIITIAIFSLLPPNVTLFIIALLFMVSAITMLPVKRYQEVNHAVKPSVSFVESIIDGYYYLRSNKKLFFYAILEASFLLSIMSAPVLVGPYVKTILHADSRIFGMSEGMLSAGAIVGAFLWTYVNQYMKMEHCILFSSILAAIGYIILGSQINILYVMLAFFVVGFSWGSFSLIISNVQILTDNLFQGRVQAAINFTVVLFFILLFLYPFFANLNFNIQRSFILLAAASIVTVVTMFGSLLYKTWVAK